MLDHQTKELRAAEVRKLRQDLMHKVDLFYGRPTERLAVVIAASLVGHDRHSPAMLVRMLEAVDELRARLTNAKV
jgi:hypothetical protein